MVNGSHTLVVWSGRNKKNKMLSDVWMAPLESSPLRWHCVLDVGRPGGSLLDLEDGDTELDADLDKKQKHKKRRKKRKKRKKRHDIPAPRKGHLAVYVETQDGQYMVGFYAYSLSPNSGLILDLALPSNFKLRINL